MLKPKSLSAVLLTLLAFVSPMACKPAGRQVDSSVKEEGFQKVSGGVDPRELAAKLAATYHFSPEEIAQLNRAVAETTLLGHMALATFQVYCKDFSGSGVFVGPNGEFLTAAHVGTADMRCEINYN